MKAFFSRTLTGKTLLRIAVLGAAVLVVFGALGAWVLYRQIEKQELERLSLQAAERARVAEQVLGHVAEMHRSVRDEFVRRWPLSQDAATANRFDELLVRDVAGAWRSRPDIADGRLNPTGWVRAGTVLTDDVRRRVVLFHDLSRQFGPGAATRNDNLFFVSVPEQSNMGYDPFLYPDFSKDVAPDYDQLDAEWGRTAYRTAMPGAPTRWSTPEIDEVNPGLGPVFAILTPVHVGERHLATVGTTILVKEFLARVLPSIQGETQYIAIHAGGRPLTDARLPARFLPAHVTGMPAEPSGNDDLPSALAAITTGRAERYSGRSDTSDMLYALARIDGPGWYVAALLPGAVVRGRAAGPVLWTVAVGAIALLLPLGIVAAMLRRQVTGPLGDLTRAVEAMAGGDRGVRLPASRDDEIGRLAAAFDAAQSELARQRDALHQSEKLSALGGLLAGVAHELNNPLSVVVGRAVQLEESASTPADRARAHQIHLAAERCARIVKTFLAMARRQDSVRAPTSLNDVVRGALELLAYTLQSSDVQVDLHLADGLPRVFADADQLSQVFLNLITNAQQAMAATRERRLRVTSGVSADGTAVRVEVTDTGPGVPPSLAGRIFDPYFTTKPVGEGTGVGLAVSLGIVQSHGGSLRLETPAEGGARFVIELPAWREQPSASLPGGAADVAIDEPLGILVVDDEAEIGALLRDILEQAGHGVAVALSGVDALRQLDDQRFDVVVTDLKMPGMDGPALYGEIARLHPRLASRVVVMTGDALGGSAREFIRAHALPLLDKPFQPREVLAVIQAASRRGT